jgi:hypothetical protein
LSGGGKDKITVFNSTPCHEDAWGDGGMAARILNFGNSYMWNGNVHASAVLPTGKKPRYPLDRKLGATRLPYRLFGEERIVSPVSLDVPACIPDTISTELILFNA